MKNIFAITFLISYIFLSLSCSKSPIKAIKPVTTPITVLPTAPPLASTIAKTDTLQVMAYNVLNYGDGCQGTTAVLDGYLKTIVQYVKPDLLSCEKMTFFQ